MIILTCRIDNKVGLEFVQHGEDQVVKCKEKALVRGVRGEWDIYCISERIGTAKLIRKSRARVECPSVLMYGDVEGIGIVPENIL